MTFQNIFKKHKQAGVCTLNRSKNYRSHFLKKSPVRLGRKYLFGVCEFSIKRYTSYDVTCTHSHIRYMMHQLAQE